MAAQTLTWGPASYGNFADGAQWLPLEAPTPNVGQTLNILGGGLSLYSAPLDDYTFNLLPGSSTSSLYLNNQVIDAETLVRQTAPSAYIYSYGTVTNFGEMQFGTTGVATATTLRVGSGGTFRNTGTIDVSGTLVVDSFNYAPSPAGTFQNNGTLSVDGGVVLINNIVPGQAGSSFIIEGGGTLELNGVTNSAISFAPATNGRLLFDQPGAASAVAAIKGFDQGDEIVIQGNVAGANYIGDGAGGTLFLANAAGAEIGRIPFSGGYTTGNFTFTAAPGAKTAIGSNLSKGDGGTGFLSSIGTPDPILDLDNYGRRAVAVTVNGENDTSFALPRGITVRGTEVSRADFLDGSLVFDSVSPGGRYVPNEDASAVARMYYTVLGRAPEFSGEKYWVGIMDAQDANIQALAPSFYGSPEFQARYGSNTTDAQLVDLLYRNILGRGGEADGTAYWQGQLGSGVARDVVAVSFSESIEHQAIRYDAIERGGIVFAGDPFL